MKRTGAALLLVVGALGVGAGFVLDQLLTGSGGMTFTPSLPMPFLLLAVAAIVVALAIPIRRATRGATGAPVDPFHALRIAMLAKASSMVGAAVGGFAVGLLVFVQTRPVAPSLDSAWTIILTVTSSAVLVAAALVAENMCTIRKDDDDDQPGGDGPGSDGGAVGL